MSNIMLKSIAGLLGSEKMRHTLIAIGTFVAISGAFLWMTGSFSAGELGAADSYAGLGHSEAKDDGSAHSEEPMDSCGTEKPVAATKECDDAKKPADSCGSKSQDPCDAKKPSAANLSTEVIAKKSCEHGIRTIDCEACRFEVGVVKLEPSLAEAMLKTVQIQETDLVERLRLTGQVQFDQTAVAEVTPAVAGKVLSVKVQLGQKVASGDVLAVLHSSELGEAEAAYLEAATSLEIAAQERDRQVAVSAALERLLKRLKDSGGWPDLDGEPLGEWKSKLLGAAARLQQAQTVFAREKSLVDKQASSKAELGAAQRELQTAQADYAAMMEDIQVNLKLERLRAVNVARLAEARVHAAEQRLHLMGVDDRTLGDLRGTNPNGRLALLEIRAPRAGTVTAVSVTEGRRVDTTQSLFTVADLSNLWVWCDLYERDLAALHDLLRRGEKPAATVRVAAFKEPVVGRVDLIDSQVNTSTQTIKVRIRVANDHGRLKPGMFAVVEIELPAGRKALLVPKRAVLSDEGRHFVFQHWKEDLWLQRHVVLGRSNGERVEVISGIEPGATVVTGGAFILKSDVLRAKMGAGCAD